MAVLIKLLFEFTRFFKLQNIEFTLIQAGGELITGCIFFTGRWAYNGDRRGGGL